MKSFASFGHAVIKAEQLYEDGLSSLSLPLTHSERHCYDSLWWPEANLLQLPANQTNLRSCLVKSGQAEQCENMARSIAYMPAKL